MIFFLVLPPLIPHVRSFPRAPLGQSARQVFLVYPCSRLDCSGTSAGFYLNRSNLERLIPVYSRFMTVSQKCIVRMYHEWSPSKESSSGSTVFRRAPWRDSALTPLLSCGCPVGGFSAKAGNLRQLTLIKRSFKPFHFFNCLFQIRLWSKKSRPNATRNDLMTIARGQWTRSSFHSYCLMVHGWL